MLTWEISKTPDTERRRRAQLLASHAHHTVSIGQSETVRAQEIQAWDITACDALHLACAESGQVDVFLTTDDRRLHEATVHAEQLRVRVENPLTWLRKANKK